MVHKSCEWYTNHANDTPSHGNGTQIMRMVHKSREWYTNNGNGPQIMGMVHKSWEWYTNHANGTQIMRLVHKSCGFFYFFGYLHFSSKNRRMCFVFLFVLDVWNSKLAQHKKSPTLWLRIHLVSCSSTFFESLLAYRYSVETEYGTTYGTGIIVLSQLYVTLLNGTAPGTFTQIETVIKPYPTVYLRTHQRYGLLHSISIKFS